jgi:hypothetical protein
MLYEIVPIVRTIDKHIDDFENIQILKWGHNDTKTRERSNRLVR